MRWNKVIILLITLMIVLSMTAVAFAKDEDGKGKDVSKTLSHDAKLLDVNQIEAWVSNDGGFGENPSTGGDGFYFPKGQRSLSIIYTAGLWFLGEVDGLIRSAVNCYGSEFQPGSMLGVDTPDDPLDEKYIVYKYNKGDVISADAIDQGCPTEVLGDQMLFSVYNDFQSHEGMWKSVPMGVEVQHIVFGFNRTGALGQTVFQKLTITNWGSDDFNDCYLGVFYDPDLGFANDDFGGTDPDLGIVYVYNGDGFDEKYGVQVPAMASDFFQGPIVPAPGETAILPDGTEIPDSEILGMTASFFYINGSPIEGMEDPNAASGNAPTEAYFFCQGFLNQGDEWVDPYTGVTKFPFSGDPVAGTGWLFGDISTPKDIRMGNASGPFNLAMGESQTIVLGNVVGQGTDNLSSVTVMKFYDKSAQLAYDMNFDLPEPPPQPVVGAANMDGEAMLYWDADAITFDQDGYVFQGYNVYQGAGVAGPWTKIATFDVVDGVTVIWDLNYHSGIGALVEMPVQTGSDSGVKNKFWIEKDHLANVPLINGRPYYFAVTAYALNDAGVPKVLENAMNGVEIIPQRPVLDTEWNTSLGDTLAVDHVGPSQGSVLVTVVDPSAITGDDYEVTFFDMPASGGAPSETGWRVTNTTTGTVLLDNQTYQGTEYENEPFEGMSVQVQGPSAGILHWIQVANPTYPEPMPADQCDDTDDYVGNNTWWSLSCADDANHNGRYFYSYQYAYLGDLSASHDYEIRWKDGVTDYSWGEWGFEDGSFGKVPFELWDVGFATPGDASDDERLIPIMYANGATTGIFDVPNGDNVEIHWGYACSDRFYFYYPDLPATYDEYHAFAEAGDYGSADGLWGLGDRSRPLARIVVINYTHEYTGPAPSAGSIDRIMTNKPNSGADTFSWSTAAYKATKNADVAKKRLDDINIFPNPYFGHNSAEGDYYAQFVTFNNLPEECTIRIFSLSGQLVNVIKHNNGTPFERWYLQNDQEIPVASGIFIIHVQTDFGDKILKFAVINREAIYQHM